MSYRALTEEEINILDDNGCWAEDWSTITVSDDFVPKYMHRVYMHRVVLYGEVQIGCFSKNVEVSPGFCKHSGINNATLRNVSVGDDCLIENIGSFINNYTIGNDCYISNVSTIETTEGATYGQGNLISVLNEVGDGNIILFNGLNSQIAALMISHNRDKEFWAAMRRLISEDIKATSPDRGTIGDGVKIVNTKEITNTVIGDECEVSGAARLSDVTILSSPNATVYIGTGVICENSIINHGSSLINSVKMQDCFVGEACKISNGFTASQSSQSPQELAAHRRTVQLLQRWLGYQLLQPRLQDGTPPLGYPRTRHEDSQRRIYPHAGYDWHLQCVLRKTDAPSRHA